MDDVGGIPPTPGANESPESNDDAHRPLGDLQRDLYARDESSDLTERTENIRQLGIRRKPLRRDRSVARQPVALKNVMDERSAQRRRVLKMVGGVIGLLLIAGAAAGATLWYRWQRTVSSADIVVTLEAPEAFTSGDEVTYSLAYGNTSSVDWHNVELLFEAPTGFIFSSSSKTLEQSGRQFFLAAGSLAAGAKDEVTVTGQLLAPEDTSVAATAELTITPANFPSGRFSSTATATSAVAAVPLTLAVDLPREAAPGERVRATVTLTNTGSTPLSDLFLHVEPAVGMQLGVEDEEFSTGFSVLDSEWQVASIAPLQSVTQTVILFVTGTTGENRSLEVTAGVRQGTERFVQTTSSNVLTLSASEFALSQEYNKEASPLIVEAEEKVAGTIAYANTGTGGLTDVVLTAQFEGVGLDEASLDLDAGAYDPITKRITWTSATVPELAIVQPGQSGEVEFDFKVQPTDSFPTEGEEVKNNTLVVTAAIDSPDVRVPVGQEAKITSDRYVMSVVSQGELFVDSFYDDGRLGLASSGPNPPKVGEETRYTVRVQLGSTLNDLGNVRVVAILPDGVSYTGNHFKTKGDVSFNDRTGTFVWTIPLVEGLTGRARPYEEVHIQVAVTPAANQAGDEIEFLNQLTVVATDQFTNSEVTAEVKKFPESKEVVQ